VVVTGSSALLAGSMVYTKPDETEILDTSLYMAVPISDVVKLQVKRHRKYESIVLLTRGSLKKPRLSYDNVIHIK